MDSLLMTPFLKSEIWLLD